MYLTPFLRESTLDRRGEENRAAVPSVFVVTHPSHESHLTLSMSRVGDESEICVTSLAARPVFLSVVAPRRRRLLLFRRADNTVRQIRETGHHLDECNMRAILSVSDALLQQQDFACVAARVSSTRASSTEGEVWVENANSISFPRLGKRNAPRKFISH